MARVHCVSHCMLHLSEMLCSYADLGFSADARHSHAEHRRLSLYSSPAHGYALQSIDNISIYIEPGNVRSTLINGSSPIINIADHFQLQC